MRENKLEPSTEGTYRGYLTKHVLPFIGKEKVGKIDAEILDSLYYEMRRCRAHQCRPLGESTIRQVHMILSGRSGVLGGGSGSV
ncbi:integrase-like protein [Haloactinopolyspora alba]|uniref:Integrase-like protein n=1 Tax=Haloactinopolyspora alba TaxID=648780 RepID=A0A2P8EFA2_9ACTN|nr:integrase-like protein [Haloactinopolyspora alba]